MGRSITSNSNIKLAPDTTFPDDATFGNPTPYISITGIDVSSGLTTLLSLTGRHVVNMLMLTSLTSATSMDLRLTIDGVVIWDDTFTAPAVEFAILGSRTNPGNSEPIIVESSLLLEATQSGETDAGVDYSARPIL